LASPSKVENCTSSRCRQPATASRAALRNASAPTHTTYRRSRGNTEPRYAGASRAPRLVPALACAAMWPAVFAEKFPNKPAYIMGTTGQVVTYRELDDDSNRVAQLLYDRGLRFGDHVAVFMDNNAEYLKVIWAAQRSGLYFTAVNYHFNAEEVAYILDDCDAKAVFVAAELGDAVRELVPVMPATVETPVVVGGSVDGYERFEDLIPGYPAAPLAEELEGMAMLYSSGTTGRPKGIKHPNARRAV